MSRFGFGRATKLVAVMALVGAPTFALLSQSPAGASATVDTEQEFRDAFDTETGTITLAANINLTCGGGGEADRSSSADITIDGAGFTINQTSDCGGRVLDNFGGGMLTLVNVTITGGSDTGNGGGVYSEDSVVLDAATVRGNSTYDCYGGGIYVSGGDLSITNGSVVDGNFADCDGGGVYLDDGDLTVSGGSTISNNTAAEDCGGFCAYEVKITDSTVTDNHALDGEGGGGEGWDGVTLTNSTVSNNDSTDEGGGLESEGDIVVTNSTISGNTTNDDGAGFNVDDDSGNTITVTDSTISGNVAGGDGGGFDVNDGETVTVIGSTLANNASSDESGGALSIEACGTTLTMVNSTVTGNSQVYDGAIDVTGCEGDGSAILVYNTIDNNSVTEASGKVFTASADAEPPSHPERGVRGAQTSDEPANIEVTDEFTSFATVIVQPIGGPNCDVTEASTDSLGYNYSDDDSCEFTESTDSDASTNDALLGALADNSGPTMTQLPANDSPLIDGILTADCGDGDSAADFSVIDDQRHVSRPQLKGCDIGAVEVRGASVGVTKVVTGTNGNAVPAGAYSFAVSCSDGTTGTLTVADATLGGTSGTIDDIFPGSTCTVTEAAVVYTNPQVVFQPQVTYDPATGAELAEGQTETVTVTNNYEGVNLLGVVVMQPKFTG